MEKLGIYIHIPFCVQKCLYCDFLSFDNEKQAIEPYVNRLLSEIEEKKQELIDKQIRTVYFGGGTPSLLTGEEVNRIMEALKVHGQWDGVEEITLEANPGTLTQQKIAGYLEAGIHRFSLGLQSAVDRELKIIGRIHTFSDFMKNMELLRRLGCRNISVDLMTGLPEQTLESFRKGLTDVLALKPEHLSCYGLTVEEGTPLHGMVEKRQVKLSDDLEREMHGLLLKETEKAGYEHYEISNFALPGFQSRHNNTYWEMGDYLGLGLGASSFMNGKRYRNTRDLTVYLRAEPLLPEDVTVLDERAWKEEWMFLGIRMMKGISLAEYSKRFRNSMEEDYGPVIASLKDQGLLVVDDEKIRLTQKGLTFAKQVFRAFLLD